MNRIALLVLLALSACATSDTSSTPTQSAHDARSDPYAGEPTIYDLVGHLGEPLPRERLLAIASYIRRLERDRQGVTEHDARAGKTPSPPTLFLAWLSESPDVTVVVAGYLSVLARDGGADVGPIATLGSLYGMTAYSIEHPGADPRSDEVQLAGVEFVLHWYEQGVLAGEPRNAFFDELLQRRDEGTLPTWYAQSIRVGSED